jgi:LmbE family N-acetylglucosaminyl deacetylase
MRARKLATSIAFVAIAPAALSLPSELCAQGTPKTLVAVFAHADDEGSASPILSRYAREGARVYLMIVTDGAQGGTNTTIARGPELANARSLEARCATDALGIQPPILLGFPDGKLGDYAGDPSLLYRLTQRLHEELRRLAPDAVITWGPDGGTGHADHRLVGSLVTQLVRAGAPGLPERLFYSMFSVQSIRTMNPQRGEPPMLVPQEKHFNVRVAFTPLEAARRAMSCHRTQYTDETLQRVLPRMGEAWNGVITFAPAFMTTNLVTDLFR